MTGQLPVVWQLREQPLAPVAVLSRGLAADALGHRLLAREDARWDFRWRGFGGDKLLLVLGEAAGLPWADGAVYLGSVPEAPSLLVPTTHAPSFSLTLLARALVRRYADYAPPLAVTRDGDVISCGNARPLTRPALQAWLERTAPKA